MSVGTLRGFVLAAVGFGALALGVALVPPWGMGQEPKRTELQEAEPKGTKPNSATDSSVPAELPDVLVPAKSRSEAEEDQLQAATHYAHSRLLSEQGQKTLALRHLQRAWRYDQASDELLAEIVPLAFAAKQNDAAARYAVLAAERNPKDALLVRRLAIYLTDKKDYARALRMYEKSLVKDPQLKDGKLEDLGAATLYAELGRLYFLTEQYEKSAAAFQAVSRALHDKDSPLDASAKESLLSDAATTYVLWGESFLEAKQFEDARQAFERANKEKQDRSLLAYRLARVAAAEKKWDEALARLDEYFAAKTDDSGDAPYQLLAKIYAQQLPDPVAAQQKWIARLRELHQAQPDNRPLALSLANALWTVGNLTEAVPLLTKTLAATPNSEGYQKLIEHHWQQKEFRELLAAAGQLVAQTGSLDALDDVRTRLQQDEAALLALRKLAEEQFAERPAEKPKATDKLQPEEEPEEKLDKRLNDKPNHHPILAAAVLLRGAGKLAEAEKLFRAVLALQPPNETDLRTQWALGLFLEEQNEAAAAMFREVLAQKPAPANPAAIRYYLAGCLEMLGKTDEALQVIDEAAAAQPANPRFENRRGWILYHAQRWADARDAYAEFLNKHQARQQPEVRDMLRSSKLALSNLELELGNFPQAVEWLEQVLDEYPEDAGALNDLGYLWADRGVHLERALRMTQQAVEQEPKNKAYRDSLGWALYRLGRYDEAARELAIAIEGEEPDGVLLEHYGDVLDKQGKPADAHAQWQRAAEAFEKEKELDKLQRVREKLAR
jgi:tetratricopeptide (TPR) repeat protein